MNDFTPGDISEVSREPAPIPTAPASMIAAMMAVMGNLNRATTGPSFVGGSKWSIEFIADVMRLSPSLPQHIPICITGPSGTGKEIIARHFARPGCPFVSVNCAALPEQLVSSILFGHVKGAFTGAVDTTNGAFLDAGQGVLFLDEIGDMPLALQPTLLRVIQERKVSKVGDCKAQLDIGCRIVCATNRNLADPTIFRPDLYARLSMIELNIPGLRDPDRTGDALAIGESLGLTTEEVNAIYDHRSNDLDTYNVRALQKFAYRKAYLGRLF